MIRWSLFSLLALPSLAVAQTPPEQVTMKLSEFLALYEKGKVRPPTPEKAPRDYAISSARYDGSVMMDDGEPVSALFTARIKVENLKKEGWVRVPLLPASVAVKSAKIGGADAPLVFESSKFTLVTDRKGAFEVVVEFAVAIENSQGLSAFAFQLPASGATEAKLSLPVSDELEFEIPAAKVQTDELVNGRRVVEFSLPAVGSMSVRWKRDITIEAKAQEPRIYAEVQTLVGVGDGLMTASVTLQETILFAGIDRIGAKIPDGMTVLDVSGSGLTDWSVSDAGELTAELSYEAEGAYTLTMQLEKVLPSGVDAQIPLVLPLNVERSKGWVGVQARGNVELAAGAVAGAAPVDVRTLPASILGRTDQPVLLGFKYLGTDAAIGLEASEHEEVDVLVTLLDQANAVTTFTPEGRRLTSVRYKVRNNRRQFLRLRLPEGAELWSASVAAKAVQPAMSKEGELLVPLVRSTASGGALSAFEVEVVYVESGTGADAGGRGVFEGQLPTADAPTTYVGWTVVAPHGAKMNLKRSKGSLGPVSYLRPTAGGAEVFEQEEMNVAYQQTAQKQLGGDSMVRGAAPVRVSMPLEGEPVYFEKLLALDEALVVEVPYKGLKRKGVK